MFLIWKNQPVLTRAAVTPAGACHYGEIVCEKLVNCDNHCATICLVFCSMEQQEMYAASSCCLYFYNTVTCALYTLDLFLLFCLLCCTPSDKKGQSHSSPFYFVLGRAGAWKSYRTSRNVRFAAQGFQAVCMLCALSVQCVGGPLQLWRVLGASGRT